MHLLAWFMILKLPVSFKTSYPDNGVLSCMDRHVGKVCFQMHLANLTNFYALHLFFLAILCTVIIIFLRCLSYDFMFPMAGFWHNYEKAFQVFFFKAPTILRVVAHSPGLSTWLAEAGGEMWVRGQHRIHSEFQVSQAYTARSCLEQNPKSPQLVLALCGHMLVEQKHYYFPRK